MKNPAFSPGLPSFLSEKGRSGPLRNICKTSVPQGPSAASVRMVGVPVKEPVTKKDVKTTPERKTKQPPMYRLYIYNDPVNKRERVVDVLLKTCQELTFSRAYAAMQEAHENGRGLVLIICQEIAEHYCDCISGGKLNVNFTALVVCRAERKTCSSCLANVNVLFVAGVVSTIEPDS